MREIFIQEVMFELDFEENLYVNWQAEFFN